MLCKSLSMTAGMVVTSAAALWATVSCESGCNNSVIAIRLNGGCRVYDMTNAAVLDRVVLSEGDATTDDVPEVFIDFWMVPSQNNVNPCSPDCSNEIFGGTQPSNQATYSGALPPPAGQKYSNQMHKRHCSTGS